MAQAKPATRVAYRSSVDGQFITRKEALKNPATTERQHIPVPAPAKKRS